MASAATATAAAIAAGVTAAAAAAGAPATGVAAAAVGVMQGVLGGVRGVAVSPLLLLAGSAAASPTLCLLIRIRGMLGGTASGAKSPGAVQGSENACGCIAARLRAAASFVDRV